VEITLLAAFAQEETADVSLTQALLLGVVYALLFGISVLITGWIARRLKIVDAGYGQALWATVFKNIGSVGGVTLLSGVAGLPTGPVLAIVVAVLPIIIYKLVFQSTLAQAALIWIVVLVVEAAAAVLLVLAALGLGAWLDSKLDMPL
jgi:hypothetical protein